jgi:DNA polymerase-3 subunit epsilon
VDQAISVLFRGLSGSFFLVDTGRHEHEQAVVAVQDGEYLGYGYIDTLDTYGTEDLLETIQPPYADPDAPRIIRGFLDGRKRLKKVGF